MSLYNFHLWTFNGNFRTNVCMCIYLIYIYKLKKIKCSRYRPGVSQRVGRGIALLLHDHGTRSRWVVSSTPRPHFTPGKVPVPILQEAGWALGPVWTSGNSPLRQNSIAARPARSQSLYLLSYPAHICVCVCVCVCVRYTTYFAQGLFKSNFFSRVRLHSSKCFTV